MPPLPRMARVVAVVACDLVLLASPARALQGVYVSWTTCFGEPGATQNKNFACNTNVGNHIITGAFVLPEPIPHVSSTESVVEWAVDSSTLPAWWQMKNTGTCRPTSLSMNTAAPVDAACVDWAQGQAVSGILAYCTTASPCGFSGYPFNPNVGVVRMVKAVPPGFEQDLSAGTQYFEFNLVINSAKTVGTGSCEGCSVPACIVFNSVTLNTSDGQFYWWSTVSGAVAPGSNFVTWQGGGSPSTWRGTGCPRATPTKTSTWGSVKALYR